MLAHIVRMARYLLDLELESREGTKIAGSQAQDAWGTGMSMYLQVPDDPDYSRGVLARPCYLHHVGVHPFGRI
jgi:hypothetical protein